jgi:hypothetical protein
LDGVADIDDKCPNTPLTDLVDLSGCTIQNLVSPHHFSVWGGISYMDSDYKTLNKTSTTYATLDLNYFYNNFSLSLNTSYFYSKYSNYNEKGMFDTYLSTEYKYYINSGFYIAPSFGIIIPTYSNDLDNKTDYFLSISFDYNLNKFDLFGGYSYTFVQDSDYTTQNYSIIIQNTNSYYMALGYSFEKLYLNISYNFSNSLYKDIEDIKSVSIQANYTLFENIYLNLMYGYGLSDSASNNNISLKLGWFF